MNVCPVYERTGGHAYGSVYPGPIGAILTPLMTGVDESENGSLPYASSLCGSCYDACPVKINIPEMLTRLRNEDQEVNHAGRVPSSQLDVALDGAKWLMSDGRRMGMAERALPLAHRFSPAAGMTSLPGLAGQWTSSRDVPQPPAESFRSWFRRHQKGEDR